MPKVDGSLKEDRERTIYNKIPNERIRQRTRVDDIGYLVGRSFG